MGRNRRSGAELLLIVNLVVEPYPNQAARWPSEGAHILAQFDAETIIVYQAYTPSIATYAIATKTFGYGFSYGRMSWIKPNFLWMMYRSGWGTKTGQEVIVALRLRRHFFDTILSLAVPSTFEEDMYPSRDSWKEALASSEARLQWDLIMILTADLLRGAPFNLACEGSFLKPSASANFWTSST